MMRGFDATIERASFNLTRRRGFGTNHDLEYSVIRCNELPIGRTAFWF